MICNFCLNEKPLVDAHIVPLCIVKRLLESKEPIFQFFKDPNRYSVHLPKGEYDANIICGDCDSSFSEFEECGRDFLFDILDDKYPLVKIDDPLKSLPGYYTISKFNYLELKLFFLSVMWKASASRRPSCKNVNLGSFEPEVREMLKSRDAGPPEKFPVFLFRYVDKHGSQTMINPHRQRKFGINFCSIGLPGSFAVIKTDQRPLPAELRGWEMAPDRPLLIAARDMESSPEFNVYRDILMGH